MMAFTITYVINNSLYINVTNRCTNSCNFCIRSNPEGISKGVDLWLEREPTSEEIILDLEKHCFEKYNEIVFCGYGEPLLRVSEIIEVCKYIRTVSDIKLRINTNGQANLYFQRDITPDLKGLIDVCSISLNASNSSKYQKECKSDFGEEAFDGIIDFAKRCKAFIPTVVFTVVNILEKDEIEACQKIASLAGIDFRVRELI